MSQLEMNPVTPSRSQSAGVCRLLAGVLLAGLILVGVLGTAPPAAAQDEGSAEPRLGADAVVFDPDPWAATTPDAPAVILVRGATLWTAAEGEEPRPADLLIRDGKVAQIGEGLDAPGDALVIDATGKHVTPGLIDAHSHTAIDGGVNDGGGVVTAQVRIEDVIDPEDVNLYRQLAGGLTAANLLHGSANPIGGQNVVIKLRWGRDADGLRLEGSPSGIKFALGENPKQSNFDNPNPRYPASRMGVEQVIRSAFRQALDYRREHASDLGPDTVQPRTDHQLETLLEIVDGERLVHAHSYRADEILMLLRLAEDFGFQVASLQHVLEGYKVADEIAAHGAGASTFSDWWAYKMEVIDAIPYNGTIMWDRGVVVSFNSDSSELARRLNLEAAKAVKYGGMPEADALQLVTLNPAIQLGVEDRIGSLEPGKDGDFVIWSGHPLSVYSIAEETWIEGRKYFDRDDDLVRRRQLAAERAALVAKVKAESDKKKKDDDGEGEGDEPGAGEEPPGTDEPPEPPEEADDGHVLGHAHGHDHGHPDSHQEVNR